MCLNECLKNKEHKTEIDLTAGKVPQEPPLTNQPQAKQNKNKSEADHLFLVLDLPPHHHRHPSHPPPLIPPLPLLRPDREYNRLKEVKNISKTKGEGTSHTPPPSFLPPPCIPPPPPPPPPSSPSPPVLVLGYIPSCGRKKTSFFKNHRGPARPRAVVRAHSCRQTI